MENSHHKANRLIHALSPYLQQHAYNPVDWYEWGDEAFEKAKSENKLLLISIGYSACHWCHVMAHESFEDPLTAELMSSMFICIKVDREELPDIDSRYMDACQLINNSGGWPLNAFALPDGRPIHALTYLPRENWKQLLLGIFKLWRETPEKAFEYAKKLNAGLKQFAMAPSTGSAEEDEKFSAMALDGFMRYYDPEDGGIKGSPKFPMPVNQLYLLQHGAINNHQNATEAALLTLRKMALGGLFDQAGGGFARYSVDNKWFAPHFEKMLYDNAQLIEAYSYAYALTKDSFYSTIAERTIDFCKSEMQNTNGLFYAAYDADSEGIEGLYYTFTTDELKMLKNQPQVFMQYFQCTEAGNWEHGRNILHASDRIETAAPAMGLETVQLQQIISDGLNELQILQRKRTKPGLDDKHICCWNSLMLKALSKACVYLNDRGLLPGIKTLADAIKVTFMKDERLYRIAKKDSVKHPGCLEDYAVTAEAFICAYNACYDEQYLIDAFNLCQKTIELFYNSGQKYFEFSEFKNTAAHIRKFPVNDDVICSGNSVMAHNLWRLSLYFDKPEWMEMALTMLQGMQPRFAKSAPWYANWASLQLLKDHGTDQFILSGDEPIRQTLPLQNQLLKPNCITGFAGPATQIPLLKDKQYSGTKLLYQCHDRVCQLPVKFD